MTRSHGIDQDPLSNSNPDDHQVPILYPGHVIPADYSRSPIDQDIEQKLFNNIPSSVPADLEAQRATFREDVSGFQQYNLPLQDQEKTGWSPAKKIIAGGAALTTIGLAALGIGKMAEKGAQNGIENVVGANIANSAPVVPGAIPEQAPTLERDYSNLDIATYPNDSFINLPSGVRIDKCEPYFEEAIKNGAVDRYLTDAKAARGYNMEGGIGSGSINDTPQQILNLITIKESIIYNDTNINEAQNLASCLYAPGSNSHEYVVSELANGSTAPPTALVAFEATQPFIQGSFANVNANGIPTRVIQFVDPVLSKPFNIIVQEHTSNTDPSIKSVVGIKSLDSSDPSYKVSLNTYTPGR